jgi:hypothetical protein
MADQPFVNFLFPAAGAPTARPMPTRLSERVNVKDWGALGNGSPDDAPKIQAAIDFALSKGGGRVEFPSGNYALSSPLNVGSNTDPNVSVMLMGLGANGQDSFSGTCTLTYTGPGFIISKGSRTYDSIGYIEGLSMNNSSGALTAGCIKVTRTGVGIRGCALYGQTSVDASAAINASIRDAWIVGTNPGNQVAPTSIMMDCIGVYLGESCLAMNVRMVGGFFIAYSLCGSGSSVINCSSESGNIGVRVGWGPSGEVAVYGCTVQALQTESCFGGIDLYNATACLLQANRLYGAVASAGLQTISAASWSGGVLTCATAGNHNIPATGILTTSPHRVQVQMSNGNHQFPTSGLFTPVTIVDATHFSYPLAADPGSYNGTTGTMTWVGGATPTVTVPITTTVAIPNGTQITLTGPDASWNPSGVTPFTVSVTGSVAGSPGNFTYAGPTSAPSGVSTGTWVTSGNWRYTCQAALRCRICTDCVVVADQVTPRCATSNVDLDYNGQSQFKNNVMIGIDGVNSGWKLPSDLRKLAGWHFIKCGVTPADVSDNSECQATGNPFGVMLFAHLPGQTGVTQWGPIEGQEFHIIDAQTAVFGAVVTGGGTNHYKVRYNGQAAQWQRVG